MVAERQVKENKRKKGRVLVTLDNDLRKYIDSLPSCVGNVTASKITFILKDWLFHQGYLNNKKEND